MYKVSWLVAVGALFVGGTLGWLVGDEPYVAAPPAARDSAESPEAPEPASVMTASPPASMVAVSSPATDGITVTNGRLSARVNDMPLAFFVDAVAHAANIPITLEPHDATESVTVDFTDVPVGEALTRALHDRDVLLLYGEGDAADQRLQAAWVWPKNQGGTLVNNGAGPSRAALQAAEPDVRAMAVEEAALRGLPSATNIVAAALADGDPGVRERALNAAIEHGVELANEQVLRMVQTDVAPAVRLVALRAFAKLAALDQDAVRSAAQYAVNDPDPSVQSTAHEILAHVTAMENTPDNFDFLTIGNNAAVLDSPADAAR